MSDKSTPIASLNKQDDSEVVNQILSKYNNLQDGSETDVDNRNLNQEIYNLNSDNTAYQEHYSKEVKRTTQQQHQEPEQHHENNENYEEEYEEFEVIQIPLWKRIINEIRIPLFIFICFIIFSNCSFDKLIISKVSFFGNQYNECNTYGFLLKAFMASLISYILIKFVKL